MPSCLLGQNVTTGRTGCVTDVGLASWRSSTRRGQRLPKPPARWESAPARNTTGTEREILVCHPIQTHSTLPSGTRTADGPGSSGPSRSSVARSEPLSPARTHASAAGLYFAGDCFVGLQPPRNDGWGLDPNAKTRYPSVSSQLSP